MGEIPKGCFGAVGLDLSIIITKLGDNLVISGQTFPVKDQIKALGGRFNGSTKTWAIPFSDEALAGLEKLQGGSPGLSPSKFIQPAEESLQLPPWDIDSAGAVQPAFTAPVEKSKRTRKPAEPLVEEDLGQVRTEDAIPTLSIGDLVAQAQWAIQRAFPQAVWVTGEVENVSFKGSSCYFNLAAPKGDSNEVSAVTVRAVMWQDAQRRIAALHGNDVIKEVLQDGMKVRCLCQVTLYKDRASLSLSVQNIDPAFTKGSLALAREQLLKKLRAEGLEGANRALTMPRFPFVVGLITSEGSRAASDFLDQLFAGAFPGEVIFAPTPMQGEAVPKMVAASIEILAGRKVDLIVISRGGGSASDLRWFDAPEIAYAICKATCPIVAAIGHHDDTCVAEMVAHQREKTPTAAAEFVLGIFANTRQRIEANLGSLSRSLDHSIEVAQSQHALLRETMLSRALQTLGRQTEKLSRFAHICQQISDQRMAGSMQLVTRMATALLTTAMGALHYRREQLMGLDAALQTRDPGPWFAKGWTQLLTNGSGRIPVKSITQVAPGQVVTARLADGSINLEVNSIEGPQAPD